MNAPVLSQPFTLETALRVDDGAGGYAVDWSPIGKLWGRLDARSAREASGLSQASYRVTVRGGPVGAVSRPVAGQRLRSGDRLFAIAAVTEADAIGRYLTCHVTEEIAL